MGLVKRYCVDCGSRVVYLKNFSNEKERNEERLLIYGCPKCTKKYGKLKFLLYQRLYSNYNYDSNDQELKPFLQIFEKIKDLNNYKFRKFIENIDNIESKKYSRVKVTKKIGRINKKIRKYLVLDYYSNGVIQCGCCGELMYEFLSIDHIKGKKKMKHDKTMVADKLYRWIIKNNFPKGFQVYCFNCNIAKGSKDSCPHKDPKLINRKITINSLVSQ